MKTMIEKSSVRGKFQQFSSIIFGRVNMTGYDIKATQSWFLFYPGRSWFQNCLNQEFIGQNFKFEVPENGLQKSIIYVFVMKKMQKKNS